MHSALTNENKTSPAQQKKRRVVRVAALVFSLRLLAPVAASTAAENRTDSGAEGERGLRVGVSADQILAKDFLGFGVQWEYEGQFSDNNISNAVWAARWPEIKRRVDFMRPAILRVCHDASMYSRIENGRIVLDFDSPHMQAMYQLLDYAQSREIPVVFGEWFLPVPYFKVITSVADPRWSEELIVPFLKHLREKRGYTNIVYFNLMNEPWGLADGNGPGLKVDFTAWKAAIIRLHSTLEKAGLQDKVGIVGTDGPGDFGHWIEQTVKDAELRSCLAAYEYHLYAHLNSDYWLPSLLEGKLEFGELLPRRLLVNAYDPKGPDKPFFMGEAGIDDGNIGDQQTNRFNFAYGVWMADYAIQSMRAGQAGLIAWNMDDAMHSVWGTYGPLALKGWGFWNSLGGTKGYPADDFAIRPWFYTWSLLCRLFPRGSKPLAVSDSGDSACRVAAARLPGGGLSFAVVNECQTPRSVRVVLSGSGRVTLHEYRYFAADRPVDEHGFPVPSNIRKSVKTAEGFTVRLPAAGVVFLTTQDPVKLTFP